MGVFDIYCSHANDRKEVVLVDFHVLESFLNNNVYRLYGGNKDIVTFPTGIFLEAVHFESPLKVDLSGYIWLKVPNALAKKRDFKHYFPREMSRNGHFDLFLEK